MVGVLVVGLLVVGTAVVGDVVVGFDVVGVLLVAVGCLAEHGIDSPPSNEFILFIHEYSTNFLALSPISEMQTRPQDDADDDALK